MQIASLIFSWFVSIPIPIIYTCTWCQFWACILLYWCHTWKWNAWCLDLHNLLTDSNNDVISLAQGEGTEDLCCARLIQSWERSYVTPEMRIMMISSWTSIWHADQFVAWFIGDNSTLMEGEGLDIDLSSKSLEDTVANAWRLRRQRTREHPVSISELSSEGSYRSEDTQQAADEIRIVRESTEFKSTSLSSAGSRLPRSSTPGHSPRSYLPK